MKFGQDDRIIYNKLKGKVLTGWVSMYGKPKYRIALLHDGTQLEVPEDSLETDPDTWGAAESQENKNNPKYCPKCYNKWKVTKWNNQVWEDCTTCNKTKEQILKESPQEKPKKFITIDDYWD